MRDTFIDELSKLADADDRIMLITGDLGFGVFDKYREQHASQFINAGVCEQNMTMLATGMALEGFKTFTYSIGNFPTLRCLEMIRNDAAYHEANVKIVCIGGGFSYGALGPSHHATEDLAILRSLPNVTVVVPSTLHEVAAATRLIAERPGTCYLRLDKSHGMEPDGVQAEFAIGRARTLRWGDDATFVVCGGILEEVVRASERLSARGIETSILAMGTLSPLDEEALLRAARETSAVVTVEEHTVVGGLGGAVAEVLLERGPRPERFLRIGLRDGFSSVVGSQRYLRRHYGLDEEAIVAATMHLLNS